MSLNLISSLSFLKSKLEKNLDEKTTKLHSSTKMDVRKMNSSSNLDMFGGITESDLDTSSSESDDDDSSRDSSRASSPSGFNTPDPSTQDGPTQDILKRCLEMLNSDISDTETLPQPDVIVRSDASSDNDFQPEIAKLDKQDPVKMEVIKTPTKQSGDYSQGLLKIASPTKEPVGSPCKPSERTDVTKPLLLSLPLSVSVPNSTELYSPSISPKTSCSPSPGPPLLEPITTRSLEQQAPASIVQTQTSVNAIQAKPVNTVVTPMVSTIPPHSVSVTQALAQQRVMTSVGQQQRVNIQPTSVIPSTSGAGQFQQIILPPVQAGQQQQFIIQPQQLQPQQQQPILQQQLIQQPMIQQPPQQQQAYVQIVPGSIPFQLTSAPIPLLNAQGQLMGSVGGVTTHNQLLTNLQNFTLMIQPNLTSTGGGTITTNTGHSTLNNPIIIKQEAGASGMMGQQSTTNQTFLTQQMIKPTFISQHQPTPSTNTTINILPSTSIPLSNQNIVNPIPVNQTSSSSINILPSAPSQMNNATPVGVNNQSSANILQGGVTPATNFSFVNTSSAPNSFSIMTAPSTPGTGLNFMPHTSTGSNVNVFQPQNPLSNFKIVPAQNSSGVSIQPANPSLGLNVVSTPSLLPHQQSNINLMEAAQSGQNFSLLPASSNMNILQTSAQSSQQNINILQPQTTNNSAMNILANSLQATTSSAAVNILPTPTSTPNVITLPTATPTTNILPPASQVSTSPTVQLVQDPATGLYNLVQSNNQTNPQPLVNPSTPLTASIASAPQMTTKIQLPVHQPQQQPLSAITESPKRSATPIMAKGSPLKVPKLLLPSLPSTKENKPTVETPTTKFMCGVCNKYFGNQKNLRVHISEIHEGKRGQFPCDVCHKVFPRKRNMERHKNALHLKNNPVCYMCHKAVVNLEMHIRRFHKGSTEIKIKVEESAATA